MSRITDAFSHGKVFIPFLTCGDPDLETTEAAVRAMAQAGADLIELGIPFSDPTAEGPVIQAANQRALAAGATTDKIFELVRRLRKDVTTPMVFMTYANVVFSYGTERFISTAAETGMDGLILPDVPYEEKGEFAPVCRKYGLDFISRIAPTSDGRSPMSAPTSEGRIAMIAREAEGFLYCVSSMGVTGVRGEITTDVGRMVRLAKEANPDLPCAVGFGVSTPDQAAALAHTADGVIVGSAIVTLAQQYGREAVPHIRDYVADMKAALSRP